MLVGSHISKNVLEKNIGKGKNDIYDARKKNRDILRN